MPEHHVARSVGTLAVRGSISHVDIEVFLQVPLPEVLLHPVREKLTTEINPTCVAVAVEPIPGDYCHVNHRREEPQGVDFQT